MNKEKLDKIESKIDEALANETPEKSLGWMWKDIEKEDSMNFICQDPDCPHCIEEINQMRDDDDDLEDYVYELAETYYGPGHYGLESKQGFIKGYKKAQETLYTKEQVRKAISKAFDYHYTNGLLSEIALLDIIQSLKQSK
jgi:hypothetical protein